MNLAEVADELYGLSPAEFTAARDAHAQEARAAGEREVSDAIRKLRRPTVSAWLVNQLVRSDADPVDQLLELGQELREAQQALDGDQIRDLSAQRGQLTQALVQEARRLAAAAGQPVSEANAREVEATFDAALADPAAADAVRSGRLTKALSYAGFGEVDIGDAVAVPSASPERAPASAERGRRPDKTKSGDAASRDEQLAAAQRERREAAQREVWEAEAVAEAARRAAEDAEHQVSAAQQEHQATQQRIEDLEQQLRQARVQYSQAAKSVQDASRKGDEAGRAADAAQRRLAQARAKSARLTPG
jgi:hypothetical protein